MGCTLFAAQSWPSQYGLNMDGAIVFISPCIALDSLKLQSRACMDIIQCKNFNLSNMGVVLNLQYTKSLNHCDLHHLLAQFSMTKLQSRMKLDNFRA